MALLNLLLLILPTLLIGAEGMRLLRECGSMGDPAGAMLRGGFRTAREKRMPAVEINSYVQQSQLENIVLVFF